jgi:hypothetical protein
VDVRISGKAFDEPFWITWEWRTLNGGRMLAMRWSKSPQCMPKSFTQKIRKPLWLTNGCSGTEPAGKVLRFLLVELMDFAAPWPGPRLGVGVGEEATMKRFRTTTRFPVLSTTVSLAVNLPSGKFTVILET